MYIYSYFLPQFYPTPENDNFWGKNFTDWVSTKNAKPLYPGHSQPYKPELLGYYNLSDSKDIKKVIAYTKDINIDGLVYWHYWFGNGFKTLEKVPEYHLRHKSIDQNYCLAWANADWTKAWQGDDSEVIFKQTYSEESAIEHFEYLKHFFNDDRYIKIKGNFLLQVNHGDSLGVLKHMKILDNLTYKKFKKRIHFVLPKDKFKIDLSGLIYDHSSFPPGEIYSPLISYKFQKALKILGLLKRPVILSQKNYLKSFKNYIYKNPNVISCILSGWDNTPRYKNRGTVIRGDISKLISSQIEILKKSNSRQDIVFIKAFNEWAEGNILEPYSIRGETFDPGQRIKELKNE